MTVWGETILPAVTEDWYQFSVLTLTLVNTPKQEIKAFPDKWLSAAVLYIMLPPLMSYIREVANVAKSDNCVVRVNHQMYCDSTRRAISQRIDSVMSALIKSEKCNILRQIYELPRDHTGLKQGQICWSLEESEMVL